MEKTNVQTSDGAESFILEDCVLWTVDKLKKDGERPTLKDICIEVPLMLQTQNDESQEWHINKVLCRLETENFVQRFSGEVWRPTEKGTAYIESNREFFEKFESLYDKYSRVSDEDQYWNEPRETS